MKILIVDDHEGLRALFRAQIEKLFYKVDCLEAESVQQAIHALEETSVDIIVSDYNMPTGNGGILFEWVLEHTPTTTFIFCTGEDLSEQSFIHSFYQVNPSNSLIVKPIGPTEFRQFLANSVPDHFHDNIKKSEIISTTRRDYYPVRISFFERFNFTHVDVFLRINANKFVKIIRSGDSYAQQTITGYIQKGQEYLYVKKQEYLEKKIGPLSSGFLTKTNDDNGPKARYLVAMEFIKDVVQELGMKQRYIGAAEEVVISVQKQMQVTPDLGEIFEEFKLSSNYFYDHSLMMTYLCMAILFEMDIVDEHSKKVLGLSCFLQDLTVSKEFMHTYESIEQMKKDGLSEDQINDFLYHPVAISKLIDTDPFLGGEIARIVLQHHERPNGQGFPHGVGYEQITGLGAIFNIVHDFTVRFFQAGLKSSQVSEITKMLLEIYPQKPYRPILRALLSAIPKSYRSDA